jgi:hypothetical protein
MIRWLASNEGANWVPPFGGCAGTFRGVKLDEASSRVR